MIDNFKTSGDCQINFTMKMNFLLTAGSAEYCQMNSKSDNLESMSGFNTN